MLVSIVPACIRSYLSYTLIDAPVSLHACIYIPGTSMVQLYLAIFWDPKSAVFSSILYTVHYILLLDSTDSI